MTAKLNPVAEITQNPTRTIHFLESVAGHNLTELQFSLCTNITLKMWRQQEPTVADLVAVWRQRKELAAFAESVAQAMLLE